MATKSQGSVKYTSSKQVQADEAELVPRALSAYFRTGGTDQPARGSSTVETLDGKHYVVLRNAAGLPGRILAVYRIRTDGMLKRLRRWPAELDDSGAPAHRRR